MKRLLLLTLFLPLVASAQNLLWSGAPSTATANQPFTIELQGVVPTTGWATIGWTLTITGGAVTAAVLDGDVGAGKSLDCNANFTDCVATGAPYAPACLQSPPPTSCSQIQLSDNPVLGGGGASIADYTITPDGTGPVVITMTAASAADVNANAETVTAATPLTVALQSLCSPGSGPISSIILQLGWSLGLLTPPSGTPIARFPTDTPPYARSIEAVLNYALGLPCTATQ